MKDQNNTPISKGDSVFADPKNGDFAESFLGTVIGERNGLIQVQDIEGNVVECEPEQIEKE